MAIDPAEFDLAILNVAANARDAMPNGGHFRVVARNPAIGQAIRPAIRVTMGSPAISSHSRLWIRFARQSGAGAVLASAPGTGTSDDPVFAASQHCCRCVRAGSA